MLRKTVLIIFLGISLFSFAQEYEYTYTFFVNSIMSGDYFYSSTYAEGGSSIENVNGRLPLAGEIFHTPGNALELNYSNVTGGNWKAVVYHHEIRGMDHFSKPEALSFWVYNPSDITTEDVLPLVQVMARDSSFSAAISMPLLRSHEWQRVMIPLNKFKHVDAAHPERTIAVVFSQPADADDESHTLYLDDIEFVPVIKEVAFSSVPVIVSAKGYAMHVDILWEKITDPAVRLVKIYRVEEGGDYYSVGVQQPFINRYADFTGETGKSYSYMISFLNTGYKEGRFSEPISASTRQLNDDELLTMVQEACFRYYWEGAEPVSGMARENIPGRHNMIATGASGFGIMALIVGTERNFIAREESVNRFIKILDFLELAETFHGAYSHFMDGPSARVESFFGNWDNGADLVETSFLMQGLLAARQYFSGDNRTEKMIREKITAIWEKIEFDWFRRFPDGNCLFWHWSPDQEWIVNHRLIGWNEAMVVYLLAIASPTNPVPASIYYTGWASQDSIAQKYRSHWGQSEDGKMYTNGKKYFGIKLDVGVNNGGPLFFTHYSYMGYDPFYITDKYTNYFANNQNIVRINYRYCVSNPKGFKGYGENGWGLTASDGPYNYSADEPVEWQDHGKLTPTGAIGSFPYTPAESMKALKNYYYNYGRFLWGEYGFRDSFNLTDNWCSEIYMGLNQAPMVVMIENYRTGLIWKKFMQDPEIQQGLKKLDKENSYR